MTSGRVPALPGLRAPSLPVPWFVWKEKDRDRRRWETEAPATPAGDQVELAVEALRVIRGEGRPWGRLAGGLGERDLNLSIPAAPFFPDKGL